MARKAKQSRVRAFFKGMSCPKKTHGGNVYTAETNVDDHKGAAESDATVGKCSCLWQPASRNCATQTKPSAKCDCDEDQQDLFSVSIEAALSEQKCFILKNLRNVLLISLCNLIRLKTKGNISWAIAAIHIFSVRKSALLRATGLFVHLLDQNISSIKRDALSVLKAKSPPLFDWHHFAVIQIVRIITTATCRVHLSTILVLAIPKFKPTSQRKKEEVAKNIADVAINNFEKQASMKSGRGEKAAIKLQPHLVSQLDFFTREPYIPQSYKTPRTLGQGRYEY